MANTEAAAKRLPDWVWPTLAFLTIGLFLAALDERDDVSIEPLVLRTAAKWEPLNVARFLAYLWWASRESEVRIVEEAALGRGAVVSAQLLAFAEAPGRFSGRVVRLDSVLVAERMGRAAFAIELPQRPTYPVVLERRLIEAGIQVTSQDRVNLTGSVYALNDSVIAGWATRGILDPAYRERVARDSTFLLADSVEILLPPMPGQPPPRSGP